MSADVMTPIQVNPDIICRAQRGDADAFSILFDVHKAKIYSVCFRMTNDEAEAEDLTQGAFLQAFRHLTKFRGDAALSTWLHRVAVNTVLMHFRKKSLLRVSLDEPHIGDDGTKYQREYGREDSQLAGCVNRIALARAIKDLPAGYRQIFILHEIKGYEHHEIADLLGCSVGNSKSQLHKARLRLRESLAPSPKGQPMRVNAARPVANSKNSGGGSPAMDGRYPPLSAAA